jgi:hypothetical protein
MLFIPLKKNLIKDRWPEPFQGRQKQKAKERPKDTQPIGPKMREKTSLSCGRKLFHP